MLTELTRLWGELRESWADMSVLIVALLGVILAVIPGKVAELEKHPKWGGAWRFALPLLLLFIGVTGFMQGCDQKHDFQRQISQLTSQVTIEATKSDVDNLSHQIDEGFGKIVDAIKELGGHKSAPRPPLKPEKPPAVVEHIRFSERRVPSDTPSSPYGLQVIVQTDVSESRPTIEVDFDGPITDGAYFVAGRSITMNSTTTMSADRRSFTVSFGFPEWTPDAPIVITVKSVQAVSVVAVKKP